jgi:Flp pilus assembly pilin Flp
MLGHIRERPPNSENGQGLGEYALILSLVAVVIIAVTALLGNEIVILYCRIVTALDPDIEAPMCEKLDVGCSGIGGTVSGNIKFEANVTDGIAPDNISTVVFKIDGVTVNTESTPKYCLNGGDGACQNYNTASLSNGSHTIEAIAYDADGNAGSCQVSFSVNN